MPPPNWEEVRIPGGAKESDVIPIPTDRIAVPPGLMRKTNGSRFKGNERPRFFVEDSNGGSKIVLSEPAPEELVFRVKEESDDD